MGEFIGHSLIVEGFRKRIKNNNLSHAHLIVGQNGLGKSILANIFAKEIMGGELHKEYIDIIKYRSAKTSFGVDEVRELIEEVNKKPFESDKKVIILYDANKLTAQAQNALLKTIEEPPNGVYIILLSDSSEVLLDTIKSRCQIYKLFPLKREELLSYINREFPNLTKEEELATLAYSEGIPGKVDLFIKDNRIQEIRDLSVDLLKNISNFNNQRILDYEKKIISYKNEKDDIFDILISFIRDILLNKTCSNRELLINSDKFNVIEEITNNISYKKLNVMLEKIEEARRNLVSNTNFDTTIRTMLMSFMEG